MAEDGATDARLEDPFDLAAINAAINETPFADKLNYFPKVESTNTLAMQAGAGGAPEGSVYFADEQTAGRGRGAHAWHSAPGSGLYVSVLLRPALAPADALWYSLAAGLAVRVAVRQVTSIEADLRWPNDLLLSGRKFCGILTELQAEATRVRHLVIGIGINVHQPCFPEELSPFATSLRIETGRHWPRQQLLIALLRALHEQSLALATIASDDETKREFLKRLERASTWVRGKRVVVEQREGGPRFSGITAGLDERGFLLVNTPDGLRTVFSGGVREAQNS